MKMPIHKAISEVLRDISHPMSAHEIHTAIVKRNLYAFKARDPLSVVKGELRRRCKELNFPSAYTTKYFSMTTDGRFRLLPKPEKVPPTVYKLPSTQDGGKPGTMVSVPTDDENAEAGDQTPVSSTSHTEIQWRLLDLGSKMGLSVWAPIGDRGKVWGEHRVGEVPRMLDRLPGKFDVATTKTIENIDVLWLEKHAIRAGIEVEHTSSIYSGLLRMSDLLTMQPNIEIRLYLVAPDERADKFAREVARPTFSSLPKPMHTLCRFLPYSNLLETLNKVGDFVHRLNPAFLDDISDLYDPAFSSVD